MILLRRPMNIFSKNDALRNIVRLVHKFKDVDKTSPDVIKYLEKQKDYKDIKMHIPKTLLRKYRTPENMYLINKESAKEIASSVKKYLQKDCPVIEVNPGFGLLSQELLKMVDHLYMYESSNSFSPYIEELTKKYPTNVTYKIADLFGMWKLAFLDKLDQGNRINVLLGSLATHDNDRTVKIIGAMPSLSFVKHLIHTVVFHHNSNQLGRPDLLIVMTTHHYKFLTDKQIQGSKHRSVPALFQMLFDYKVIKKIQKVHYLPWMYPPSSKKSSVIEENLLYLVNITQKKKLPCSSDFLGLVAASTDRHKKQKDGRNKKKEAITVRQQMSPAR